MARWTWMCCCLIGLICFTLPASATFLADEDGVVTGAKSFMQTIEELDRQYRVGSIVSAPLAELALSQTEAAQTTLQSLLRTGEQACAEKFFVNSCLEDQKHWRRKVQDLLKRINIEAKSFLRRNRVVKLDGVGS